MNEALPETVLQFGAGNFLRAFADLFIHQANEQGQNIGRIVVVQSTDSGRAAALNAGGAAYHVVVRGMQSAQVVDEAIRVTSVSRALNARSQWDQVLNFAESPALKIVLSNATEAGLSLSDADAAMPASPAQAPTSFPAKLVALLKRRFDRGLAGLTIMPCELVEANGRKLRDFCLEQATRWKMNDRFLDYLRSKNIWLNSLVDRIVSGKPAEHPLLATDPLLTAAEPFALWAIETSDPSVVPLRHPAIVVTPDVQPFSLRKIRILNGAHSALVCRALPMGIATVREAIEHPQVGPWLRELLFEEIVPVLEGRVPEPRQFAEQTLERFANPFLQHKLSDIALNHDAKLKTRLIPTLEEYRAKFGKEPARLSAILSRV
jgi:tagaturonate reductase